MLSVCRSRFSNPVISTDMACPLVPRSDQCHLLWPARRCLGGSGAPVSHRVPRRRVSARQSEAPGRHESRHRGGGLEAFVQRAEPKLAPPGPGYYKAISNAAISAAADLRATVAAGGVGAS
jgi:hypothetical protein